MCCNSQGVNAPEHTYGEQDARAKLGHFDVLYAVVARQAVQRQESPVEAESSIVLIAARFFFGKICPFEPLARSPAKIFTNLQICPDHNPFVG